mmetsp:Transcript_5999/g.14533  ORF Transcript_5999/g.14533 Transcript_5999/m.14533 type:complete len:239 (+) Transcript_5999:642-1358(+)
MQEIPNGAGISAKNYKRSAYGWDDLASIQMHGNNGQYRRGRSGASTVVVSIERFVGEEHAARSAQNIVQTSRVLEGARQRLGLVIEKFCQFFQARGRVGGQGCRRGCRILLFFFSSREIVSFFVHIQWISSTNRRAVECAIGGLFQEQKGYPERNSRPVSASRYRRRQGKAKGTAYISFADCSKIPESIIKRGRTPKDGSPRGRRRHVRSRRMAADTMITGISHDSVCRDFRIDLSIE